MIDIKQLRIGDFVKTNKPEYFNTDFIFRIESIDSQTECEELKGSISGFCLNDECPKFNRTKGIWINYLEPIELTEELLLKLGFKKEVDELLFKKNYYAINASNNCNIEIYNEHSNSKGKDWSIHIDNSDYDSILYGDIQYLHQLQNYIYDACGLDIEYKIN